MADRSSRHDLEQTYLYRTADGRELELLIGRTVPSSAGTRLHRVEAGDRLDLLAQRYFGDPFQYWRIVDANPTISTDDLMLPGTVLRIPPRT
jgi:nucleoid-associated protein YgaU